MNNSKISVLLDQGWASQVEKSVHELYLLESRERKGHFNIMADQLSNNEFCSDQSY